MGEARCFRIDGRDNVATMLDDVAGGEVRVIGESGGAPLAVTEPIELGHKVALRDIAAGEAIVKYGVPIGRASRGIRRGAWVHLH
ncbi:MAG: UxaA family hydrolase, partial [Planctomycetes bacterium]|nr:UxaA family hydrolase [Planctomycetota bacterium]